MIQKFPLLTPISARSHQDPDSKDLVIVCNNCPAVEHREDRDEECDDSGCVTAVNSSSGRHRVIQNKQDEVISVGVLCNSQSRVKYTDTSINMPSMALPFLVLLTCLCLYLCVECASDRFYSFFAFWSTENYQIYYLHGYAFTNGLIFSAYTYRWWVLLLNFHNNFHFPLKCAVVGWWPQMRSIIANLILDCTLSV